RGLGVPETPTLAVAGRAYSGLRPVLNRLVYKDENWSLGTSKPRALRSIREELEKTGGLE
ncbi:MAG: hypothetical protein Q8N96_01245, partial [Methylovulum sp.]|nr:hypothetical protein [Methylovulum sp.]